MRQTYKILSLFSGAGGLDAGLLMTGSFEVATACEIVPAATQTYARNFRMDTAGPGSARHGTVHVCDVRSLDFSTLSAAPIHLVSGGPPCQDFSVVRGPEWDRRGIREARGRLYLEMRRAVETVLPLVVVFENVPGLLSANRGAAYRSVLRALTLQDSVPGGMYSLLFARVVDAVWFGVPQTRRRLVAVLARSDLAEPMLASLCGEVEYALSARGSLLARYPMTPIEVFEGRPLPDLAAEYRRVMRDYKPASGRRFDVVADYLRAIRMEPRDRAELDKAFELHERTLRELGYLGCPVESIRPGDGTEAVPREAPHVVSRMMRIRPGENHEAVRGTQWHVEGRGISLVYRRLHPLRPAYTIVAFGGGGTWGYHYRRDRSKLTNRERARLQTFTDRFLFSGNAQQVRAQIGEAVPPLLGRRIGEACARVIELASAREACAV